MLHKNMSVPSTAESWCIPANLELPALSRFTQASDRNFYLYRPSHENTGEVTNPTYYKGKMHFNHSLRVRVLRLDFER